MVQNIKTKVYDLLRWSEQYTKTDMVYLARGSFWLTAGNVINSVAVFLSAIAFANLLPKETYGIYKYVLSISGILSITTLGGMEHAVAQAVAKGQEKTFPIALKTRVRYGFWGFIASLLAAGYYYSQQQFTLAIAFALISIFIPFIDTLGMYQNYLQNKKLFNVSATYGSISQVIAVIVLVTILFLTKNLFSILLGYFAIWTLLRFIFLKITLKKFPPNENYDPQAISYGKHASVINIMATLIGSLDNVLLFHYLGAADLAIYSFAIAPIAQLRSLTQYLPTLALPKLAQRPVKEIDLMLKKRIVLLFLIGIIIAGGYFIITPLVYKIFFPKYLDAIFYSQIFAISIALTMPHDIFGSAVSSKLTSTPKKMLYLWNMPSIVLVASLFLFIPRLGILGVIFSKMLSAASVLLIDAILWRNIKKIDSSAKINDINKN